MASLQHGGLAMVEHHIGFRTNVEGRGTCRDLSPVTQSHYFCDLTLGVYHWV